MLIWLENIIDYLPRALMFILSLHKSVTATTFYRATYTSPLRRFLSYILGFKVQRIFKQPKNMIIWFLRMKSPLVNHGFVFSNLYVFTVEFTVFQVN